MPASVRVRSTLHKYLNQQTLALLMFIVLALLGTIGGKESQIKQPSFDKGTIGDLTIRHQDQGGCAGATKPGAPKKLPGNYGKVTVGGAQWERFRE